LARSRAGKLDEIREVGKFNQAPSTGGCSVERRGKSDQEQKYAPKNEQKYAQKFSYLILRASGL
jgi:hypothetical protein